MLVAQLSDPHLTTGALGAEPAGNLSRAVGRVLGIEPRPDCIVITGDLVDRGLRDEYTVLEEVLAGVPVPVHLVLGNHDDRSEFASVFGHGRHSVDPTRYVVDYPDGVIVVLDSLVPRSGSGELGESQLAWLSEVLERRPVVPTFVALHHPPIPIGIPFLDTMRLQDGAALATVIAAHPQVVRVLAGHVHRTVFSSFAGTQLAIAPSTYRTSELAMRHDRSIGYLAEPTSFLLHSVSGQTNGVCITHSVPVSHAAALEFARLPDEEEQR